MRAGESVEEHKSVIMHLLSQVRLSSPLCSLVLPARLHMYIRLWHLSVCVESRWSSAWTSPRSSFRLSFWKGGRCSKCTPTSSHIPVSFSRKSPLYSCFFSWENLLVRILNSYAHYFVKESEIRGISTILPHFLFFVMKHIFKTFAGYLTLSTRQAYRIKQSLWCTACVAVKLGTGNCVWFGASAMTDKKLQQDHSQWWYVFAFPSYQKLCKNVISWLSDHRWRSLNRRW